MNSMLSPLEVQKEILKSKVNANFSHYCAGNMYYLVKLESGLYQFQISTVTERVEHVPEEVNGAIFSRTHNTGMYDLSEDLGTTSFRSEEKASMLFRWIKKAIENDSFIKVG